jgi:hypothetical protein
MNRYDTAIFDLLPLFHDREDGLLVGQSVT